MKHLIWGMVSLLLGLFFLLAALLLIKEAATREYIYGAVFVAYGIYRLYLHFTRVKPPASDVKNPGDA